MKTMYERLLGTQYLFFFLKGCGAIARTALPGKFRYQEHHSGKPAAAKQWTILELYENLARRWDGQPIEWPERRPFHTNNRKGVDLKEYMYSKDENILHQKYMYFDEKGVLQSADLYKKYVNAHHKWIVVQWDMGNSDQIGINYIPKNFKQNQKSSGEHK